MPGSGTTLSPTTLPDFADGRSHPFLDSLRRLPGRILLSWSMAGGVIAGGLVAGATLTGRMSSSTDPQLSTALFLVGAGVGVAHGGLLGYLSRDPARTRGEVIGALTRV